MILLARFLGRGRLDGPQQRLPIRQLTIPADLPLLWQPLSYFATTGIHYHDSQRSALRISKYSSMPRFQSVGFRPKCGVRFMILVQPVSFPLSSTSCLWSVL